MKYVLSILSVLFALSVTAQRLDKDNINYESPAFAAGEHLKYIASYRSFVINTNIAEVNIKVSETVKHSKPAYYIDANARVFPFYRWFFDMNDSYYAWLEKETLRPIMCKTEINEDSYRFRSTFVYDWDEMKVTTNAKNPNRNTDKTLEFPLKPFNYDGFSLFYNLRSANMGNIKPGWSQMLGVVLEAGVKHLKYTFLGREVITLKGIGKFNALKFSCQLTNSESEAFPEGSEFYAWFTDDRNKIPLYVETPLRVGKARVTLESFSGLKYPLESLISKKK